MNPNCSATGRGIAAFGVLGFRAGVNLHQLREVNVFANRARHSDLVRLKTVCGELHTPRDALLQIVQQCLCVASGAFADDVGDDQLALGIRRRKEVLIATKWVVAWGVGAFVSRPTQTASVTGEADLTPR